MARKSKKKITEFYWIWNVEVENKTGEKKTLEVTLPRGCSSEAYVMYCAYREEGFIPEGFDIKSVKRSHVITVERELEEWER